jgi:hypothetical protein
MGMTATNPTGTARWGTYLDITEVWEYLQEDNAPTGAQQTRLQRLIDSACTRAQEIADRPLCPTRRYERHDGWSGEYIQLDYSPFLQLVLCVENMSSGGPVTLPESLPASGVNGVQINYATSMTMRTFDGTWPRPFFPGSRNIEYTYVAGFNPIPPDIWEATIDFVAYKWRMTQESPRWFGQSQNEFGGQQTDQLYPGIPNRIAEVFESYRLPGFA